MRRESILLWQIPKEPSDRSGVVFRWVVAFALIFFWGLYFYWRRHLPITGKAILVIGLVAVLMVFDIKAPMKAACVLLVFALALQENRAIDHDQDEASKRATALISLSQDTNNNTTLTVTNVGLLLADYNSITARLNAAQKKNEQALVRRPGDFVSTNAFPWIGIGPAKRCVMYSRFDNSLWVESPSLCLISWPAGHCPRNASATKLCTVYFFWNPSLDRVT